MYEPRLYRTKFNSENFKFFTVVYKETDLYIGIDKTSYHSDIEKFSYDLVYSLRNTLDEYIKVNKEFLESHIPIKFDVTAPLIANEMMLASYKADVGPMATVAGAFAEFVGTSIEKKFGVNEIIVENGGDIYLNIRHDLTISIYAGNSPLSEKTGLIIDHNETPLGICTSSGTVGHSFSYGKADAVTIVCKSSLLSDAYATAYCNKIKEDKDVNIIIDQIKDNINVISAVIIKNNKFAVAGKFRVVFFK
jgi:ApbE superfamily uncharacterized protein (UPF0280 family)